MGGAPDDADAYGPRVRPRRLPRTVQLFPHEPPEVYGVEAGQTWRVDRVDYHSGAVTLRRVPDGVRRGR